MKGVASLDTGHDLRVGESLNGASSSTPISRHFPSPNGWDMDGGFTQVNKQTCGNDPGIKASIPRPARRWLRKLRQFADDARCEKVVEALKDDDTIDNILAMLDDDGSPQCSSSSNVSRVSAYLLELNIPSLIHDKIQS